MSACADKVKLENIQGVSNQSRHWKLVSVNPTLKARGKDRQGTATDSSSSFGETILETNVSHQVKTCPTQFLLMEYTEYVDGIRPRRETG